MIVRKCLEVQKDWSSFRIKTSEFFQLISQPSYNPHDFICEKAFDFSILSKCSGYYNVNSLAR